jgi:hypothetical protein
MAVSHKYAQVRWLLLIGLLLVILKSSYDLITHPVIVSTAGEQALVYLTLFVLALLIYGWFALFRIRASTASERIALQQGTLWGLLCGSAWIFEVVVANLAVVQPGWLYLALYYCSAFTAYLLPGVASMLAAWRTTRMAPGLQAGLLCGICGGLMTFLAAIALSAPFLKAAQYDPQTIYEFQHSGLPDITTYVIGDFLASMIAHLWIGLITGLLLGVVGAALGKALATPRSDTRSV